MPSQSELIKIAVLKSLNNQEKLTKKQVNELNGYLSIAAREVKDELNKFDDIAPNSLGQAVQFSHFLSLKENIDKIVFQLNDSLKPLLEKHTETAFKHGISDGVLEKKILNFWEYAKLTSKEIKNISTSIFSQIDKSALEFLVNYRLELMGDVTEQLKQGIKKRIAGGIISGKNTFEISKDIGKIITDTKKFRKAGVSGKTVFKTAQQRIKLIARTEINRAHNFGRLKFYDQVGVKKVQWWSSIDNRSCAECVSRHGNVYTISEIEPPPLHAMCRCCLSSYIND